MSRTCSTLIALIVAGCGARTAFEDPAPPIVSPRDAGRTDAGPIAPGDGGHDAGVDAGPAERCDTLVPSPAVTLVYDDVDDFAQPFALVATPEGFEAYARKGDAYMARTLRVESGSLVPGPIRRLERRAHGVTSQGHDRMLCARDPPGLFVGSGVALTPRWVRALLGTPCYATAAAHDQWLLFTDDGSLGGPPRARYLRLASDGATLDDWTDFRSLLGGPRSVRATTGTSDGFAWVSSGRGGLNDIEVSRMALDGSVTSVEINDTEESNAIGRWPHEPGSVAMASRDMGHVRVDVYDSDLGRMGATELFDVNHCRYDFATGAFGLAIAVESSGPGDQTTRVRIVRESLALEEVAAFERVRTGCSYFGVESDGRNLVLYAREVENAVAWLLTCAERE